MGWLRYLFLGDIGQQLDISDQRDEIAALRREVNARRTPGDNLQKLQAENDQLKLTLTSLTKLLIQKRVISDNELMNMIELIDGADGSVDGRISS